MLFRANKIQDVTIVLMIRCRFAVLSRRFIFILGGTRVSHNNSWKVILPYFDFSFFNFHLIFYRFLFFSRFLFFWNNWRIFFTMKKKEEEEKKLNNNSSVCKINLNLIHNWDHFPSKVYILHAQCACYRYVLMMAMTFQA